MCRTTRGRTISNNTALVSSSILTNVSRDDSSFVAESSSTFTNPFGPAVGEVKEVISCVYEHQKGDLYVTSKAICFRAGWFGLSTCREILPWNGIQHISLGKNNGVNIVLGGNGYEFENFASVHESIQLFQQFWKNHRCCRPNTQQGVDDPIELISYILSYEDIKETRPQNKGSSTLIEVRSLAMALCYPISLPKKSLDRVKVDKIKEAKYGIERQCLDEDSLDNGQLRAWKDCLDSKEVMFSEIPVKNLLLDCSLDTFLNECINDNGPHSLVSFHSDESGDFNAVSTVWNKQEDGVSLERTITYTHPVQQRMAPPTAEVTKTQILRKYGAYGISILTKTVTKGVPVSDCFYVEDRLLVHRLPGENRISLSIAFDVRFVKNTLLRKIVERVTKQDVSDFHNAFSKYLEQSLNLPIVLDQVLDSDSIAYEHEFHTFTHKTKETISKREGTRIDLVCSSASISNVLILLLIISHIFTSFQLHQC